MSVDLHPKTEKAMAAMIEAVRAEIAATDALTNEIQVSICRLKAKAMRDTHEARS